MNANELRIGICFIPISDNGDEFEQRQLKASEVLYLSKNPEKGLPIPITEEWLVMFGFEKVPKKDYFTLYLSDKDKDENEFGRQRIDYWFGKDYSSAELCRAGMCFKRVKIKYVHQLQNLYYALTGTELENKSE